MIDRYGPQIEADLHREFGLDLLDFFRGEHPWGKLLRLLDQMPVTSKYIIAQRADDDYVQRLVDSGIDLNAKQEMTEDGYGPIEARLDNLADSVNAVRHALLQVAGEKPGNFTRVERPVNAIQKFKEKARLKRHYDLLDEVAAAQERRRHLAG